MIAIFRGLSKTDTIIYASIFVARIYQYFLGFIMIISLNLKFEFYSLAIWICFFLCFVCFSLSSTWYNNSYYTIFNSFFYVSFLFKDINILLFLVLHEISLLPFFSIAIRSAVNWLWWNKTWKEPKKGLNIVMRKYKLLKKKKGEKEDWERKIKIN